MRFVVVVILAFAAACTKPVDQPAACEAYVRCYLDDDGAGLAKLIEARKRDPQDPELACYDGFAVADDLDDLDLIVDPMLRAYGDDGTCWAGGYSSVSDTTGLETKYVDACEAHCRIELAAECARSEANQACAGDDGVKAFCDDVDNADLIAAARCPGGEGEGEGE